MVTARGSREQRAAMVTAREAVQERAAKGMAVLGTARQAAKGIPAQGAAAKIVMETIPPIAGMGVPLTAGGAEWKFS